MVSWSGAGSPCPSSFPSKRRLLCHCRFVIFSIWATPSVGTLVVSIFSSLLVAVVEYLPFAVHGWFLSCWVGVRLFYVRVGGLVVVLLGFHLLFMSG